MEKKHILVIIWLFAEHKCTPIMLLLIQLQVFTYLKDFP